MTNEQLMAALTAIIARLDAIEAESRQIRRAPPPKTGVPSPPVDGYAEWQRMFRK